MSRGTILEKQSLIRKRGPGCRHRCSLPWKQQPPRVFSERLSSPFPLSAPRFPAKRKGNILNGLLPDCQGQNPALTVLYVPCWLNGGPFSERLSSPSPLCAPRWPGFRVQGSGFRGQGSGVRGQGQEFQGSSIGPWCASPVHLPSRQGAVLTTFYVAPSSLGSGVAILLNAQMRSS